MWIAFGRAASAAAAAAAAAAGICNFTVAVPGRWFFTIPGRAGRFMTAKTRTVVLFAHEAHARSAKKNIFVLIMEKLVFLINKIYVTSIEKKILFLIEISTA